MLKSCQMEGANHSLRIILHKGVRKAHFAAVDDAIADTFDEGKDIVVFGVENDLFEC